MNGIEFLENVKARGWDLPGYGVHINIDRGNYTRFDVGRSMRFIAKNADKVARIAGRDTVYNGSSRGLPIADRVHHVPPSTLTSSILGPEIFPTA